MKSAAKILFALLLLAGAVFSTLRYLPLASDRSMKRTALVRREIALRVLAEFVAREFTGQKVLVVSNPFTQRKTQSSEVAEFEEAGLRGLKKGWANRIQLQGIGFPELDPALAKNPSHGRIDPQTTTPLSFMTTDGAWDNLLRRYPDTEVVVSLIGLPATLHRLEIWRQSKPRFALLLPDLRMIGDAADVKEAFRSGKLAAVVLEKPSAPPESTPIHRDYHAEFNQCFVLITASNADTLIEESRRIARR
ncbi:MAG: hypothetical protein FJ398_07395 [Verrucomicrobia bacterium]|nr:hypothetical protein [Verrucomicrobiota bacterium]